MELVNMVTGVAVFFSAIIGYAVAMWRRKSIEKENGELKLEVEQWKRASDAERAMNEGMRKADNHAQTNPLDHVTDDVLPRSLSEYRDSTPKR